MADSVFDNRRSYPGTLAVRLVGVLFGLIEAVFALRLLLELLGANAASPIVAAIYSITNSLLGPFADAFPNFSLGAGYIVDVNVIVAMIGYAVLSWLIMGFFSFVFSSTRVP